MAVDLYLNTKDTGDFKAFKGEFTASAICMEAKTSNLQTFKLDRHIGTEELESKAAGAGPVDLVGLNRPIGGTLQSVTREAIEALHGAAAEAIWADPDAF